METLKSLLTPGEDRDNEQLYGTGEDQNATSAGNKHSGGLSGEGSHLARSTGGSHSMPGQYPSDSTMYLTSDNNYNTSNVPPPSNIESKMESRAAGNSRPIGEGAAEPNLHAAGYPNMGPSITSGTPSSQADQEANKFQPGMSGSGALRNQNTSHTGNTPRSFPLVPKTKPSTAAGPPSSTSESKLDPKVHSNVDGSRNVGNQGSTEPSIMDRSYPIQRGFEGSTADTTSSGYNHGSEIASMAALGTSQNHHNEGQFGSNATSSTHTGQQGISGASHQRSHQDPLISDTTSYTHNDGGNPSALATAAAATALTSTHHPNEGSVGSNTGSHGISEISHHDHGNQGHLSSNTASSNHTGLHGTSGVSHHHQNEGPLGSNTTSSTHTGLHGKSGPHQTQTANLLDPRVAGGSSGEDALHHHGHQSHERKPVGGGAEEADRSHKNIGVTSADATQIRNTTLAPNPELTGHHSSTSHSGRDAALGAGVGLGVAGLATQEVNTAVITLAIQISRKMSTQLDMLVTTIEILPWELALRNRQHTGQFGVGNTHGTIHQSGSTGVTGNTNLKRDTHTHGDSSHHTRDAALGAGAGVGAASLAKHEHDKHQADRTGHVGNAYPTTSSYNAFRSDVESTSTNRSTPRHGHPADYGRDAVLGTGAAAGVGSAAYEAEKHQKEKELEKERKHQAREHEKDLKKEHKREEKHAHEHEKKEEKKHRGLFSFLHRDKSKKYSDEEEKEFDRQEREHNASQTKHGYEAAGAGALGVGAAGLYQQHKHHGKHSDQHTDHHSDTKQPPTAESYGAGTLGEGSVLAGLPGQSNLGADKIGVFGAANKTTDVHPSTTTQHSGHHTPTTTGSSAGAAALDEHEHNKHYTTSGKHSDDHSTGHHHSGSHQPRLSEADFDQHGNQIGSHHIPSAYGTESGHDGRNRLHKDPPAGHPAAQAMAEHSGHGHGHGHGSSHDAPSKHEDLTGAVDDMAGNTGVKNAGGNTY
ncbi:hypothetical protein HYALB_00002189 [Hymenoscyphus albidus]|uniref:Uncharacterized protein n=1 Tax=Hymenoscyphus albidus TaxID=595503 RepID=A0A9N9LEA8_9HELO|nr:hypothetical protein HYALB_00002189 [Hymenoscyphus albidus]